MGSFTCWCNNGFSGDGFTCISKCITFFAYCWELLRTNYIYHQQISTSACQIRVIQGLSVQILLVLSDVLVIQVIREMDFSAQVSVQLYQFKNRKLP